jgi:hypothetical protein
MTYTDNKDDISLICELMLRAYPYSVNYDSETISAHAPLRLLLSSHLLEAFA